MEDSESGPTEKGTSGVPVPLVQSVVKIDPSVSFLPTSLRSGALLPYPRSCVLLLDGPTRVWVSFESLRTRGRTEESREERPEKRGVKSK